MLGIRNSLVGYSFKKPAMPTTAIRLFVAWDRPFFMIFPRCSLAIKFGSFRRWRRLVDASTEPVYNLTGMGLLGPPMGLKKHAEHSARRPPLAPLAGGANRGWQQGIQADPSSERHGYTTPQRPRSRTRRRPLGQRGGLGNKGSIVAPWVGDFTSLLGRGTSVILLEIGPWNIGKNRPPLQIDLKSMSLAPIFNVNFCF